MSKEWLEEERIPLSSEVNLTKKQLNKIGLDSLHAYATTSPEEFNKFFENLKEKQKPLDPTFSKILNDNFLDLF